jgi:hypothetical protein
MKCCSTRPAGNALLSRLSGPELSGPSHTGDSSPIPVPNRRVGKRPKIPPRFPFKIGKRGRPGRSGMGGPSVRQTRASGSSSPCKRAARGGAASAVLSISRNRPEHDTAKQRPPSLPRPQSRCQWRTSGPTGGALSNSDSESESESDSHWQSVLDPAVLVAGCPQGRSRGVWVVPSLEVPPPSALGWTAVPRRAAVAFAERGRCDA